jgi:NMD protein affecting ribosome stability and mRNA decay
MGWRNDIRVELMSEAAARQRCRRCGKPVDDSDDPICDQCQYDDWHEEIPEVLPQEDGE